MLLEKFSVLMSNVSALMYVFISLPADVLWGSFVTHSGYVFIRHTTVLLEQ